MANNDADTGGVSWAPEKGKHVQNERLYLNCQSKFCVHENENGVSDYFSL